MAVFSRYSQVLEADGTPMRVRAALVLINQTLDEFLTEQEGEFDSDTRWALAWFEQFGQSEGPFGDAETLSKAKNTSIDGLVRAGILEARAGKVRLLGRDELDPDWTPERDDRRAVWEATQYLIRALDQGGEQAAADLLRRLGSLGETARDLAYRLYSICGGQGWGGWPGPRRSPPPARFARRDGARPGLSAVLDLRAQGLGARGTGLQHARRRLAEAIRVGGALRAEARVTVVIREATRRIS